MNQNTEVQNANMSIKQIKPRLISKLNDILYNFIKNNGFFVVGICLALYIKYCFLGWQTGDFNGFIKNWYNYFGTHDGFSALKDSFYDYTPPYLYLIWVGTIYNFDPLYWTKGVSIAFEFLMAFFVAKIIMFSPLSQKVKNLWQYSFVIILLLPTVVMNASLWGQCDAIYTSFVIGSLYFLIRKNWIAMMIFFGIGMAVKLQTIFFAPVLLVMVATGYLPISYLFGTAVITILIYLLGILPAYLVGRPLLDTTQTRGLLTIYTSQSNTYKNLTMGSAPTMYQWIKNEHYDFFYKAGLGIVSIAVFLITWLSSNLKLNELKSMSKINGSTNFIIKTAMLSSILVPFFLPKMHERYFFLADVISIIYAFYFPRQFWISIMVVGASTFAYFGYLLGTEQLPTYLTPGGLSMIMFIALIFVLQDWIKDIFNHKTRSIILK